jgi:catechol 2,3-dioxygenase-like lactoylglutathione lyase family enzyme
VDLLVNLDVPELDKAVAFYTSALGLAVGRRFGEEGVELADPFGNGFCLLQFSGRGDDAIA